MRSERTSDWGRVESELRDARENDECRLVGNCASTALGALELGGPEHGFGCYESGKSPGKKSATCVYTIGGIVFVVVLIVKMPVIRVCGSRVGIDLNWRNSR